MARSVSSESNLPKYLWTDVVMRATYVQNCCYCQGIDNTSHWLVTELKPIIANLRVLKLKEIRRS